MIAAAPRTADRVRRPRLRATPSSGRIDEAREVLDAALRVDPASGQVHYNLGEIARVRGDLADGAPRVRGRAWPIP